MVVPYTFKQKHFCVVCARLLLRAIKLAIRKLYDMCSLFLRVPVLDCYVEKFCLWLAQQNCVCLLSCMLKLSTWMLLWKGKAAKWLTARHSLARVSDTVWASWDLFLAQCCWLFVLLSSSLADNPDCTESLGWGWESMSDPLAPGHVCKIISKLWFFHNQIPWIRMESMLDLCAPRLGICS